MFSQHTATQYPWLGVEPRRTGRWVLASAGLALGLLLGSAVTTAATHGLEAWQEVETVETAVQEWPKRPLPKEWRWSPPGVKYQHMFRERP